MLSIIIPAYNEEKTVLQLLRKVCNVQFEKEIIFIDDGSTDQTARIASTFPDVLVIHHPHNRGKGAAIRTGLTHAMGDIILIQDADLSQQPVAGPYHLHESQPESWSVFLVLRYRSAA